MSDREPTPEEIEAARRQAEQMQEQPTQLVITLLPNGQVSVSGIINNKLMAYGLLECARDAISDFNKEQQAKGNGHSLLITRPRY